MLYNVVLISPVPESESAIHLHISPPSQASLPPPIPPIRSSQSTVLYSNFPLAIYYTHSSIYMSVLLSYLFQPLLPPLCLQVHALCLFLYSCPADRFISSIFLGSLYALIYNTCFSLSDLLQSVRTDSRSIHALQAGGHEFDSRILH